MRPMNVVLALADAASADRLATALRQHFRNLTVSSSPAQLTEAMMRLHAPFAVVDLELVSLSQLRELCRKFPATAFVGVHRLADDRMWTEALGLGAVDCCLASDVAGILLASDRYVALNRRHAAA